MNLNIKKKSLLFNSEIPTRKCLLSPEFCMQCQINMAAQSVNSLSLL